MLFIVISVTVLSYNAEETIEPTLKALEAFDEVILLDTGSKDKTLKIAEKFKNVKVLEGQFNGFGPLHNFATMQAKNDWILSIDSDEVMTKEAVDEILSLNLDPHTVYGVSFKNYYNGKWISFCGWYPEHKLRLYNRKITKFNNEFVHENIITDGLKIQKLSKPVYHYSYRKISHFLTKMEYYSELFANQNRGKRKSSLFLAIVKSWAAFFRSYILKKGIFGGKEGYIISRYQADVAFYKYLKLDEKNTHMHL
jgi:glycosyltransferase involved in cell wall biosynthesis